MELEHPLLAIASTPISDDSPCGINAKYESSFEALESELAKQESLTAEKVDWKEVKALATDLLQNTTKDFLVTCYLTHSLTVTEGYKGLLVGCRILEGLTENFWQDSFPPAKRLRARKTAIEWLVEKTSQHIEAFPPANSENAIIVEVAKTIKNLDFSLSEKMEAHAPNISELNRSLKRLKQAAEFDLKAEQEKQAASQQAQPSVTTEPTQATSPVTSTPEPSPDTSAPVDIQETQAPVIPAAAAVSPAPAPKASTASSSPVAINTSALASDNDAKKLLKQVQEAQRQLAEFHSAQKASDPKRYRYSRSALWDSIDKLPPNKENKTQLPKPPGDKFSKLQELFNQGEFGAVIEQAEKSASKMPYWFNGQRLIANSLEALGGEFTKAAEALIQELRSFLQRVPTITALCYSDGTPFADEQTLLWLNTQVLATQDSPSINSANDEVATAFNEAQKLASSGKLTEGLLHLKQLTTSCVRDEFRLKLASAELIAQSGKNKVAIPILERLINEAKTIKVIDWESDLIINAYSTLVQSYDKLDDAETKLEQREAAFDQLCWFDPTSAAE